MNLLFILPILLIAGIIFLLYASKRSRPPASGPDNGTLGRPDEFEPQELRGDEQHRRRQT